MSDEPSLSVDRVLNSLPGRVLLVILAAAAVAVFTPQIFRVNQMVPFLILRWSVVALVGVVSGLVSRYILSARTAALRLWTALLAALVGLILLGLTTEGTAGAILPERSQAELNWTWLVQFAFSALLAWLTLSAYPPALPEKATRRKRKSPAPKTDRTRKSPAKKPAARRTGASTTGTRRSANAKKPAAAPRRASSAGSASNSGSRSTSASSGRSRTPSERPAAGRSFSGRSAPAARSRAASPAPASTPAPSRPRPRIYPAAAHPYSLEEPGSRTERGTSTGRSTPPTSPTSPRPASNTAPAPRRPATPASPAAAARPASTPAPSTPRPATSPARPPSAPRPGVPMRPPSTPARRPEPLSNRLHGWNDRLQSWWRSGVRPTAASTPAARAAGRPLHWPSLKRRPPASKTAAPAAPTSVRLVGAEEHRCPFCLELVEPDDSRGIVECSICHTQHHADCWEITGACQVPHYHG